MAHGGRTYDQWVFKRVAAALITAAIALIAGCGNSQDDQAPAACLVGNEAYLNALEKAPAPVLLAGTTPISDCLVPEQEGGQLASIGQEMIVAATKLNAQSRQDPSGQSAWLARRRAAPRLLRRRRAGRPLARTACRRIHASRPCGETGAFYEERCCPNGFCLRALL